MTVESANDLSINTSTAGLVQVIARASIGISQEQQEATVVLKLDGNVVDSQPVGNNADYSASFGVTLMHNATLDGNSHTFSLDVVDFGAGLLQAPKITLIR